MSADHRSCALCGRTRELQARFGLAVCDACEAGDFDAGLAPDWGAVLRVDRSQEVDPKHYESALVNVLCIDLDLPHPSPCAMRLVPERGGHRLVKFFREEYQVGDKDFDDAVYIADEHREATQAFLSVDGVREAVLVLLREEFAKLELEPTHVHYRARHRGVFDPKQLGLLTAMVALGRHLDAMATV